MANSFPYKSNILLMDRWLGFGLAIGAHLIFFYISTKALVKPIQYGIVLGRGGIEINLVAALPQFEEETIPSVNELSVNQDSLLQEQLEDESPEDQTVEEAIIEKKDVIQEMESKPSIFKSYGDGSSSVLGDDPTTIQSVGGAETLAKPNYLKNPPPLYPSAAIRLKQEGVVKLLVIVDKFGNSAEVAVKESSGFSLLDASALKAVRRWKFSPAKIGSIPIESKVEIPIRFQLQ